jgi:hypothetical protein
MNGDTRKQLEQRADAARSRLERNLEVLDERRERFTSVARAAARSPLTVVLIGAVGLTATVLIARRMRRRPSVLERIFRELAASAPPPPREDGLLAKALKRAAVSLVVGTVQRLGTRGVDRWLADPDHDAHAVASSRAE